MPKQMLEQISAFHEAALWGTRSSGECTVELGFVYRGRGSSTPHESMCI
jgi:hypothetical protein